MLPDNELATHYVYGRLLHSDEWRLAELEKHGWEEEAFPAMLYQVHALMRLCHCFRQRLTMFTDVSAWFLPPLPRNVPSRQRPDLPPISNAVRDSVNDVVAVGLRGSRDPCVRSPCAR